MQKVSMRQKLGLWTAAKISMLCAVNGISDKHQVADRALNALSSVSVCAWGRERW